MDRLFRNLPRELQWEILTEFVGTHVVRYNRLMRRMSGAIQSKLSSQAKHSYYFENSDCRLKQYACYYGDRAIPWYWTNTFDPELYTITEVALGVHGNLMALFKNSRTGELSYGFYSRVRRWSISPIRDTVTLPPYVKREYPSYPYTNKKLHRTGAKVVLY